MRYTNFYIELLEEGKLLVVPTSYLRPECYLDQLESLLIDKFKSVTCVYFDFLIKNGTKDRFYKADLSDSRILLNSFSKIKAESMLIDKSNSFFAKNISLINDSYLTKAQKFLLKRKFSENYNLQ